MIHHRTEPMSAADRGYAFGSTYPDEIVNNIDFYRRLFFKLGGISEHEIVDLGAEALIATRSWAPDLADEIEAVAAGARLKAELLGALNARTEILGRCRTAARECSVAVVLGPQDTNPVAIQTWDWHDAVEQGWLVWTIEHPTGRTVHTLTEYGIVGKIGVCSRGLGLLLNILRHADDGEELGTPVHIIARRVLDEADDVNTALLLIGSARPSASSAMTLIAAAQGEKTALTVEVWPDGPSHVLPDERGVLVHTNHFLDSRGAAGDQEPVLGPDSLFRYEILRRRLCELTETSPETVLDSMRSHLGAAGAICCHPDPEAELGDRYATLATVTLDVPRGRLIATAGGPCAEEPDTIDTGIAVTPVPAS